MHDCLCCGEDVIYADVEESPVCDSCVAAGCEPNDGGGENDGIWDDCQIPRCPECDTHASFLNDKRWHSNCEEDDCPKAVENRDASWS